MRLQELQERRAGLIAELEALPLDGDESRKRFDELRQEVEAADQDIARKAFLLEAERRMAAPAERSDSAFERECRQFSLIRAIASQVPDLHVDAGREREVSAELQRRSGRQHQGITVPCQVFESRVLTTVAPLDGPGGTLIPVDYRPGEFIDILRARLVTRRLGARILSNLTGNVDIPKLTKSAAAGWVAENAAITASDPEFGKVQLRPKHVGAIVEFSRNMLLQSSPDIEQLVRADFAAILGQSIDRAAIQGGGDYEPVGVLETDGIGSVSLATVSWAKVLEFVSDIEAANVEGTLGWLAHPLTVAKLRSTAKIADTDSQMIMDGPNELAGYPLISSTLVPTTLGEDDNKTALLFGAWGELMIGYWSEFDVLVNPYETTAYSKGNVMVRGMASCDAAVRHPEAFAAAVDVA